MFRSRFLSAFLLISIALLPAACRQQKQAAYHSGRRYVITADSGGDTLLSRMLQPYRTRLDAQMDRVIGHADTMLVKEQPESALGNFLADAVLKTARDSGYPAELAVANYGSIRLPYIPAGPVRVGTIYELMPFDNRLVVVEMPGTVLRRFCQAMAGNGGWPVSGLGFVIRDKRAEQIQVNGSPLHDSLMYRVAVNDYIANGGDNCAFLTTLKQEQTKILVRDALIGYVQALEARRQPLHPVREERIRYAE